MRAGLDWRQLDFVADHHGITAPILLFHGVHDQYVPEAASEAFARALPRQVTFVPIAQANHVEAWNADPARYAEALNRWCDSLGIGHRPKPAATRSPAASASLAASPSRPEVQ
jgi:hypothetical protein